MFFCFGHIRFLHVAGLSRVLSRPWAADAYLQSIIKEFVDKEKSITKQITHSEYVKDIFTNNRANCREEVKISKSIRDFAYAPQR